MKTPFLVALAMLVLGCAQPKPMTAEEVERERFLAHRQAIRDAQTVPVFPVSMGCAGHRGAGYIHSYAVQEPIFGQFSRGMVSGLSCGGTVLADYPLPETWTPGMKVKVRWNRPIKGEDNWIEKTTTILPYDKVGMLIVHFFPQDQVRVVVSNYYPESPHHPIHPTATTPPPEIE